MKKLILWIATSLLGAGMAGCSNSDVITDYIPVTIQIKALDADGQDLFDPTRTNNLMEQGITFDYAGKTNRIEVEDTPLTREYLAVIHPPILGQKEGGYYVTIGEWAGNCRWEDETIVINWPDGTHNTISFTLKKMGVNHAKYYLDGKKQKGHLFTFTYPANQ